MNLLSEQGMRPYLVSMKREKTDIFIAGGGVAGLTAAAVFGAEGFRVICVEPNPPVIAPDAPGADLRTTAFLQPARQLLQDAGIWETLEDEATPLDVMRIVDASGHPETEPTVRDFRSSDIGDAPFGWNLRNWALRRDLYAKVEQLETVCFLTGVGFAKVLPRDASAIVTLTDGRQIEAKLIIAADGRDSPLREAAGIGVRTARYGQKALSFAVTHDMPHDNVSTEIHQRGGPFTFVPLPDHHGRPCSAVVWMTDGPEAMTLAALPPDTFSQQATARSAGLLGDLKLVVGPQVWPIISQTAERMNGAHVALMAEAAHVLPPIGAQGLNMSLADMECLKELALADPDDLGSDRMLASYHRLRHPDIALRAMGISVLNRASQSGDDLLNSLRTLGLKALHDVTPVRRNLMRIGLGTKD